METQLESCGEARSADIQRRVFKQQALAYFQILKFDNVKAKLILLQRIYLKSFQTSSDFNDRSQGTVPVSFIFTQNDLLVSEVGRFLLRTTGTLPFSKKDELKRPRVLGR